MKLKKKKKSRCESSSEFLSSKKSEKRKGDLSLSRSLALPFSSSPPPFRVTTRESSRRLRGAMTETQASTLAKAAAAKAEDAASAIERSNASSVDDSVALARAAGARLGSLTALERTRASAKLERSLRGNENGRNWMEKEKKGAGKH